MSKRGMGNELAGLTSGVMFSPQQEAVRLRSLNIRICLDVVRQMVGKTDLKVEIVRQPSKVYEFRFTRDGTRVARRSLDADEMGRLGGKTAAGRMLEGVWKDLGIPFSWDDVPDAVAPEGRSRVDTVGLPYELRPVKIQRIEENPVDPDKDVTDETAWSPAWTIRQLKAWSAEQGKVVPAEITRKGDVLEWLANEYPDGG